MTSSFVRTRLAPTPSGYLHLGNALSFARTAALARRHGARLLLRIDDMDAQRATPAFVADVFDTLSFLQLRWDEGPRNATSLTHEWSQRHRMPLYQEALQHLAATGRLFACTCSRADVLRQSRDGGYAGACLSKQLPLDTPGAAWRLYTPPGLQARWRRLDGAEAEQRLPPEVQHPVVRKRDGDPAYQLCSVVDDNHFGIDLVVRGEDLLPSTCLQVYLAGLLPSGSFPKAVFLHHPLLRNEAGEKLSKSAGSTSVWGLRQAGKSSAEIWALAAQLAGLLPAADTPEEVGEALLQPWSG